MEVATQLKTPKMNPAGDYKYRMAALFYAQTEQQRGIIIQKFLATGKSLSSFYRYLKIEKGSTQTLPLDVAIVFADIFNMLSGDLINK